MKKLIAAVLVLLLCLSSVTVLAVEAEYSVTQAFVDYLDEYNVHYQLTTEAAAGKEKLLFTVNDQTIGSYDMQMIFTPESGKVTFRVWNIGSFDDAVLADAYRVVNNLNANYLYVKFYIDENENTVTAEYDLMIAGSLESANAAVMAGFTHVTDVIREAAPDFAEQMY